MEYIFMVLTLVVVFFVFGLLGKGIMWLMRKLFPPKPQTLTLSEMGKREMSRAVRSAIERGDYNTVTLPRE